MRVRSGAVTGGRLRLAALALICLVAILAFPASAHAEAWASQYPFGTIHTRPTSVSVDLFGTAALNASTAVMTIDGVPQRTFITQGPASGHWVYSEVLIGGVWRARWTWVADAGGSTKATLSCSPSALGDGTHAVTASVRDVNGVLFSTGWSFTITTGPVFGAPLPAAGATVRTPTPVISIPVSDDTGVASVGATVKGAAATATLAGGKLTVTGFTISADGPVTVAVSATDTAGNNSTTGWTFMVSYFANQACTSSGCHGAAYDTDPSMGTNCVSCHPEKLNPDWTVATHGYDPVKHAAAVALCETSGCHTGTAVELHPTLGCANCHPSPGTITACNTVGCHADKIAGDGSVIFHGFDPAKHVGNDVSLLPDDTKGCTNKVGQQAGCHDITNIATLHAGAPGGACPVCHTPGGRAPSTYCRSCHPKGFTDSVPASGTLAGTMVYHHFNTKYLNDPTDRPAGAYYWWTDGIPYHLQSEPPNYPAHGTNEALSNQDCLELCHQDAGQSPVAPASGSRMWYSLGSADPYPAAQSPARTLTRSVAVPAGTTTLTFKVKWALEYYNDEFNIETGMEEHTLVGTDSAVVQVSTDGGATWHPLLGDMGGAGNPVTGASSGWVDGSFDLSAYAGQTIQLRFLYAPEWRGAVTAPADGWAIDDIAVTGSSGTVFSDGAETLAPGWTNLGGGWDRRGATFF